MIFPFFSPIHEQGELNKRGVKGWMEKKRYFQKVRNLFQDKKTVFFFANMYLWSSICLICPLPGLIHVTIDFVKLNKFQTKKYSGWLFVFHKNSIAYNHEFCMHFLRRNFECLQRITFIPRWTNLEEGILPLNSWFFPLYIYTYLRYT